VGCFDSNNEIVSTFLGCLEAELIKIFIGVLFADSKDVLWKIVELLILTNDGHADGFGYLVMIFEGD
jgi:hypothetical protein